MKKDKLNDKIRNLMDFEKSDFFVMEERIDVTLQMNYFKMVRKFKGILSTDELCQQAIEILSDENAEANEKQMVIAGLAASGDVEAFRIVEKYREVADESMKEWMTLAYYDLKLKIESKLKDTPQIFVSTGLGGRDGKLRYFFVLFPTEELVLFSESHQKFIESEVTYLLEKNEGIAENFEKNVRYISFEMLYPFHDNLEELIEKLLEACNQLGPIILDKFIVTNMKRMNEMEIFDFLVNGDDFEEISRMEDTDNSETDLK